MTVIKLDSLSKRYGNVDAVTGVSLVVPEGQAIGLLGPNGCGKTTLLKMIAGILPPDGGTVVLNGCDLDREREAALQQISAIIQGIPSLDPEQSIAENLPSTAPESQCLLHELDLWPHRHKIVGTLSHGLQRRVALGRALLADTQTILLDEPMAGLDDCIAETIKAQIRTLVERDKKTVVIATCSPKWINAFCDRAAVFKEGRLIADVAVDRRLSLAQEAIYQIRVKGVLETRWATWFDGLTVTPLSDETILCGTIVDQPALHSVLIKIRDLGLPLISLHHINPDLENLSD